MSLVYVIEDDPMMSDVIALAARSTVVFDANGQETHPDVQVFNDAVEPISEMNTELPDVILLDVLLSGPDGFTFLNELISYHDTAKIPVVLITSLDMTDRNLEHYGVFRTLDKATMTPEDIRDAVLAGLEKRMSAPELGVQKLNQQLRQIEQETALATPGESSSAPAATPDTAQPTESAPNPGNDAV